VVGGVLGSRSDVDRFPGSFLSWRHTKTSSKTPADLESALTRVRQEPDLSAKSLLLAGVVSELFREREFEPVVVGGSAIAFYTDGAYMSGDTNIC
jgi:hypothetical protein